MVRKRAPDQQMAKLKAIPKCQISYSQTKICLFVFPQFVCPDRVNNGGKITRYANYFLKNLKGYQQADGSKMSNIQLLIT